MAFSEWSPTFDMNIWTNINWYETVEKDMHKPLSCLIRNLDKFYVNREVQLQKNMQLYGNIDPTSLNPLITTNGAAVYNNSASVYRENVITWNICKSAVDTVCAKISKNKVKVMITTEGAPYNQRKKSQKLDKAISSHFKVSRVPEKMKQAFKNSLIEGDGIIQIIDTDKGPKYEIAHARECMVDPLECVTGKPSTFYRFKFVDRSLLLSRYPKLTKEIKDAPRQTLYTTAIASDLILVFEAWKLPCDEKPGKHCICLDTATLFAEDYLEDEFPFTIIGYSSLPLGFWHTSLVDEIGRMQMEINKILGFVQRAMQLNHAPKWLVDMTRPIPPGMLNNQLGAIVKHNGIPPQYVAPLPINEQVIQYLQMLKNEAYAIAGISQLSARSEKPAGLNSGRALQTYNDIESERFILQGQSFEEAHVDLFKKSLLSFKRSAEKNPELEILAFDRKRGSEKLRWSEIDLEKDKYHVSTFPVSSLPTTPEARIDYVNNLVDTGKIDNDTSLELIDMPDVEGYISERLAAKHAIEAQLDEMIENGIPVTPDEYDNVELAFKISHTQFLEMRKDKAPDSTLDLLRGYMSAAETMLQSMKDAANEEAMRMANMQQMMQQAPAAQPAPQVQLRGAVGG